LKLKTILHFLIFSNIFIACCALALTYSTFYLLNIPAALNWYLLLIFLCTLFVYNLHYYIKGLSKTDLRLDWCKRHSRYVVISIFACAFFILGGVAWHYKAIFIHQGGFNYRNLFWFIIIPFVISDCSNQFLSVLFGLLQQWHFLLLCGVKLLQQFIVGFSFYFCIIFSSSWPYVYYLI